MEARYTNITPNTDPNIFLSPMFVAYPTVPFADISIAFVLGKIITIGNLTVFRLPNLTLVVTLTCCTRKMVLPRMFPRFVWLPMLGSTPNTIWAIHCFFNPFFFVIIIVFIIHIITSKSILFHHALVSPRHKAHPRNYGTTWRNYS